MSNYTMWRLASEAPSDGSVILADFGQRNPVFAVWNNEQKRWSCSYLRRRAINDKDCYFESIYFNRKQLLGWIPMPQVKMLKAAG